MKIEILGMGCIKCNSLYGNVRKAVTELGLSPEIEHVRDMEKIIDYGVMSTPALVINGKVTCFGRVPEVDEIKEWINDAEKN